MFLFEVTTRKSPVALTGPQKAEAYLIEQSIPLIYRDRTTFKQSAVTHMINRLETAYFGKPLAKLPSIGNEANEKTMADWLLAIINGKDKTMELKKAAAFLLPAYVPQDKLEATAGNLKANENGDALLREFKSHMSIMKNPEVSLPTSFFYEQSRANSNAHMEQRISSSFSMNTTMKPFFKTEMQFPTLYNVGTNLPGYEVFMSGMSEIVELMGGEVSQNSITFDPQAAANNIGVFFPRLQSFITNWFNSPMPNSGVNGGPDILVRAQIIDDLKGTYSIQNFQDVCNRADWRTAFDMLKDGTITKNGFGTSIIEAQNLVLKIGAKELQELTKSAYSGTLNINFNLDPEGKSQIAVWLRNDGVFLVDNTGSIGGSQGKLSGSSTGLAYIGTFTPHVTGGNYSEIKLNFGGGATLGGKPDWFLNTGGKIKMPLYKAIFGSLGGSLAAIYGSNEITTSSDAQIGGGFTTPANRFEMEVLLNKDLSLEASNLFNNTDFENKGKFIDDVSVSAKYRLSTQFEIALEAGAYTSQNLEGNIPFHIGVTLGFTPRIQKKEKK